MSLFKLLLLAFLFSGPVSTLARGLYFWSDIKVIKDTFTIEQSAFIYHKDRYYMAYTYFDIVSKKGSRPLKIANLDSDSLELISQRRISDFEYATNLQFFKLKGELYLTFNLKKQRKVVFLHLDDKNKVWNKVKMISIPPNINNFILKTRGQYLYLLYSTIEKSNIYTFKVAKNLKWIDLVIIPNKYLGAIPNFLINNKEVIITYIDNLKNELSIAKYSNRKLTILKNLKKIKAYRKLYFVQQEMNYLLGRVNREDYKLYFYEYKEGGGIKELIFFPQIQNVMYFHLSYYKDNPKELVIFYTLRDGTFRSAKYREDKVLKYGLFYKWYNDFFGD